jgi:hypothetical protein
MAPVKSIANEGYYLMTTVVAGTKVEAKWDAQKRQEVTARIAAANCLAVQNLLQKVTPELKEQYENQAREYKVQAFKKIGVRTPLELVQAMAEVDANVYGSKVEISGDDTKAQIKFEQCAVGKAIQEVGNLNQEQMKKMFEGMDACAQKTAKEFGFKAETRVQNDTAEITFSK